jgi:hypothetical protein
MAAQTVTTPKVAVVDRLTFMPLLSVRAMTTHLLVRPRHI